MSKGNMPATTEQASKEITIKPYQVELIKSTVAKGATDDELELFFYECRRRGVHPLDRKIHFVKRGSNATFQCSIDYMRSQAESTGDYRGQDDVEYGPMKNSGKSNAPEWATVTVRRMYPDTGEILTTSATAYWEEFYPSDEKMGFNWRKMPRIMLAKCAEAQALRKAFPQKLGGLYSHDEMEQADMEDDMPVPIQPPQAKAAPEPDKQAESIDKPTPEPDAPHGPKMATEKQVNLIKGLLAKLDVPVTDDYSRCMAAGEILGFKPDDMPESLADLSSKDASKVIGNLQKLTKDKEGK